MTTNDDQSTGELTAILEGTPGPKGCLPSKPEDSDKQTDFPIHSVSIDERSYDTFDDASLLVSPPKGPPPPTTPRDCGFDIALVTGTDYCDENDPDRQAAREEAAKTYAPIYERIASKHSKQVNAHTTKEAQDTRAFVAEDGHNTRALLEEDGRKTRRKMDEVLTSHKKLERLLLESNQKEGIRTRLFDGEAGAPEPPKPKRRRMGGKSREDRIAARNEDAMRAHYQRANARKRAAA